MQLLRKSAALAASFSLFLAGCGSQTNVPGPATNSTLAIKHVIVIYDENVSFDHYFGTYPNALNLQGENPFTAASGTPSVNGLSGTLLTANPNPKSCQRRRRDQSLPPRSQSGCDRRPGSLLHAGTNGLR